MIKVYVRNQDDKRLRYVREYETFEKFDKWAKNTKVREYRDAMWNGRMFVREDGVGDHALESWYRWYSLSIWGQYSRFYVVRQYSTIQEKLEEQSAGIYRPAPLSHAAF